MIQEYLVSVRKYVPQIDDSLILSFQAFTPEEQKKLVELLERSTNKIKFHLAVKHEERILFKLERFTSNLKTDEILFILPCGYGVKTYDNILDTLKDYDKVKMYIMGDLLSYTDGDDDTVAHLTNTKVIIANKNDSIAKEILKEHKPREILPYIFGYTYSPTVNALIIPRILGLFKVFGYAFHVLQFTPPASGKSHVCKIASELTNSYYSVAFPSRAKLIGDARYGSYGLCGIYDCIFIEEFDKLSGKRLDEFKENYEMLFTGMEQGVWQREKSSRYDINYKRNVSLVFVGNTIENIDLYLRQINSTSRKILTDYISSFGVNPVPFIERLGIVEILKECDSIMKYINYNSDNDVLYLHPAVSRSILDILQDTVSSNASKVIKEGNRYDRHTNMLYNILKGLGYEELDVDRLKNIVIGYEPLYNYIIELETNLKKDTNVPEVKEEVANTGFDLESMLKLEL